MILALATIVTDNLLFSSLVLLSLAPLTLIWHDKDRCQSGIWSKMHLRIHDNGLLLQSIVLVRNTRFFINFCLIIWATVTCSNLSHIYRCCRIHHFVLCTYQALFSLPFTSLMIFLNIRICCPRILRQSLKLRPSSALIPFIYFALL